MINLKNILSIAVATVVLTSAVFAFKPENPGSNGKAYGHLSKEDRMAAIIAVKNAKVRPVTKAYMYPSDTSSAPDARYDYDEDAWGMLLVKHKKDVVKFHGHNLAANKEYTLKYDGVEIGKAISNDEGNLKITGSFSVSWEDYDVKEFTLSASGEKDLESRFIRLHGAENED